MSTTIAAKQMHAVQVAEFFLARQSILDRSQQLCGYEPLFRNTETGPACVKNDLAATAAVIAHTAHLGLEQVVGNAIAFLNVDDAVLRSDIFRFLPQERVVLEIIETMPVTPAIIDRIAELASQGFRFALDDVIADGPQVQALLPLVQIVKLDLCDVPDGDLQVLAARFKAQGKLLLAEKVESREQFDACMELGFDYFQGYYFAHPTVLKGKKLSPSQLAVVDLLTLVVAEADDAAIEKAIKRDISLCINLLRLANTPFVGTGGCIDSIAQALRVLGRDQLRRWLQIMLYADATPQKQRRDPLLILATTRARMLELLAQQHQPGDLAMAETAFTIGMVSLMDALFGMPMVEVLCNIPVSDAVGQALLERHGVYGDMLCLVECTEQPHPDLALMSELLGRLRLRVDDLYRAQLDAFGWSESVSRRTLC
ncbi:EAL and modified HD-GYP domain-containing signal transduction protein [Noviherbaspirillum humi]|uniref:EAL and modified HD-GYP domain-containing signal transduction protein n=1 Tax=Noviherbaspirillum humi TaxID=1688639 RepID=A0A239C8G8_9BURK|nr:EAL domain-containing protein [Noviherbaspirillum humi]SNS16545.1 EAL and modified HD-GYP domain-containing signal transduction protein [Noviherbaspirillum humi]